MIFLIYFLIFNLNQIMDRNIDPQKLNQYLSTLNDKDKKIVQTIVDNTLYITTNMMIEGIKRCIDKLHQKIDLYNLYIPSTTKIGSEHYILMQVKNKLKPIDILYGTENINNEYPIVMLDDIIYSSCNMCGHIDNLRYYTGLKNKVYIIVHTITTTKVQVSQKYFNTEIIYDNELENLQACNLIENYDYEYMYKHFKCETEMVLPLYLDHKIANTFGSYQFYHKIIKNPISRKIIDDISVDDINNLIIFFTKKTQ